MEYVGTRYAGFQRQPGKQTVQSAIESAVAAVTQTPTPVVGSGRTDAGAHAASQVIAFSTSSRLSAEVLGRGINAHLPRDIAITSVWEADEGFHPRYDALARTYRYLIWNRPVRSPFYEERAAQVPYRLDHSLMNQAAGLLIGRQAMGAFVPAATRGDTEREIFAARCWRRGDLITIELEATGFMRQMVRAIAGTLIRVGAGQLSIEDFAGIVRAGRRELAAETAPARGLYLVRVRYPEGSVPAPIESTSLPWPLGPDEETV